MNPQADMKTLAKAIEFASKKHALQRRKSGDIPYINHPIQVFNILVKANVTDYNVLCAAILHDTVQDTETTPEELQANFNQKIKEIVLECSDDKSLSTSQRKRLQIEHAKHVSTEAKLVKMADKISNNSDLFTNAPTKWTPQRIKGYFLWSYLVCRNLKGVNEILDKQLESIFERAEVLGLSQQAYSSQLEEYLKLLTSK